MRQAVSQNPSALEGEGKKRVKKMSCKPNGACWEFGGAAVTPRVDICSEHPGFRVRATKEAGSGKKNYKFIKITSAAPTFL